MNIWILACMLFALARVLNCTEDSEDLMIFVSFLRHFLIPLSVNLRDYLSLSGIKLRHRNYCTIVNTCVQSANFYLFLMISFIVQHTYCNKK